jgi:hypothetical protein
LQRGLQQLRAAGQFGKAAGVVFAGTDHGQVQAVDTMALQRQVALQHPRPGACVQVGKGAAMALVPALQQRGDKTLLQRPGPRELQGPAVPREAAGRPDALPLQPQAEAAGRLQQCLGVAPGSDEGLCDLLRAEVHARGQTQRQHAEVEVAMAGRAAHLCAAGQVQAGAGTGCGVQQALQVHAHMRGTQPLLRAQVDQRALGVDAHQRRGLRFMAQAGFDLALRRRGRATGQRQRQRVAQRLQAAPLQMPLRQTCW